MAGFTATAVVSVSDQPATLLVCLNRRSQVSPILRENHVLCVNTLRAGADTIADVFAGRTGVPMAERFDSATWTALSTGSPVLTDAVVAFDCRVIEIKAVATHNVVFAGVVAVRGTPGRRWSITSGPTSSLDEPRFRWCAVARCRSAWNLNQPER